MEWEEESLVDRRPHGRRHSRYTRRVIFSVAVALCLATMLVTILIVVLHPKSAPSDEVHSLPGIGRLPTRTLSGFLSANTTYGAHLYYLFMESQHRPKEDPVILWLQGGPGSTSMFGCFCEFGPYMIEADGTFYANNYSWNERANILWIDQPVGTGYSYVEDERGYNSDEVSLSLYLYTALVNFMKIHPEYSHQPFYIFGESYAGKYVPWLAHNIINNPTTRINFKGSGIGNGWVAPRYQAPTYATFLYNHSLITEKLVAEADVMYQQYLELLDKEAWEEALDLDNEMFDMLCANATPPVTNYFDIRYPVDPTDAPYYAIVDYMRRDDVMDALHTKGKHFSEGDLPYELLSGDEEQSALFLLPEMLQDTTILLYNGEYDLICNWMGTAQYAEHIDWPAQEKFNNTQIKPWTVDGVVAGNYKSADKLVQLVVYDAGHMSPYDQPKHTQAMLYQYIEGAFFK